MCRSVPRVPRGIKSVLVSIGVSINGSCRDQIVARSGHSHQSGCLHEEEDGLTFKHLWEPAELSALRDNMQYDGQEKLIQSALIEGWAESECIRQGIKNAMAAYAINTRHELEIHDPTVGWAVVIPAQRSDLFRKNARWLHECNHPSETQQYRQIRRRFYWHSPSKMRAEISSVHSECVSCTLRKRSTRKPAHNSAPIEVGHRPFSVISVDPKDMPLCPVTGYDNMVCVSSAIGLQDIRSRSRTTGRTQRQTSQSC